MTGRGRQRGRCRPPPRPPDTLAERHVRADRDRGAACPAEYPRGQYDPMESQALRAYQRATLAADAARAVSCRLKR